MTQKKVDDLTGIGKMVLTWVAIFGFIGFGFVTVYKADITDIRSVKNTDDVMLLKTSLVKMQTDIEWIRAKIDKL